MLIDSLRSACPAGLRSLLWPDAGDAAASTPEPWGRRLWLTLAAIAIASTLLLSYGLDTWPMADDEVPSLVELGLLDTASARFFSVPPDQIPRLRQATIVWNTVQRAAIHALPDGEARYRIPSVVWGVLTAALAFLFAARWRGYWFAMALTILVNASATFVFLMQLNRFYAFPMLLQTLAFAAMWSPQSSRLMVPAIVVLTALAVLSHNITLVAFVIAFMAAVPLFILGRVSGQLVVRTGVSAAVSVIIYVAYLLPIVRGWASTGNPTPVLLSYAAYAGVPALALASLGAWLSVCRPAQGRDLAWWTVMLIGIVAALLVTSGSMSWNPRYFLFLLPPVWILGAHAMEWIAARMGYGSAGAAWYGAVLVLLVPGLISHYQDGTRHDYRAAARVLIAEDRASSPILSDDAETISYYLPANLRQHLEVRTKVTTFPTSEFFLVCRSNAWMPGCRTPGRRQDLLGEISHRRFDQFSHILRVYRVEPVESEHGDKSHP